MGRSLIIKKNFTSFLFWVFIVIVFLFMCSFILTRGALVLDNKPPSVAKWLPDFILGLFIDDIGTLAADKYVVLISDLILLLGFLIAIVPIFQMRKSLRKLREDFQREHGIKSSPIKKEGEDDLEWMLSQFKGGNRFTIFAGGFGWLNKNSAMRTFITTLADERKLNLVSHGTEDYVKKAFSDGGDQELNLFRKLESCFKFDSQLDRNVVCTMIQNPTTEWKFLYKGKPDDGGHAFNACVLGDAEKNRVLLHILSELTKANHWGEPSHNNPSSCKPI